MALERITNKYLLKSLLNEFDLEKGWLYSLMALFRFPAKAIKDYFYRDRNRLVKPFKLLFFTVAIASFLTIQFEDSLMQNFQNSLLESSSTIGKTENRYTPFFESTNSKAGTLINQYFVQYFNVFNLMSVPVFALVSFLFFHRQPYNYAEHLVLNSYTIGYQSVIYIVCFPLYFFQASILFSLCLLLYQWWAYYSFFKSGSRFILLKSILCIIVAYFSFLTFTFAIMWAIIQFEALGF